MDLHEEDGDIIRSSRSQMFSKIGALKKLIFNNKKERSNIHRKTPVLESVFNKIAGLRPATLFKRDPETSVFLCETL